MAAATARVGTTTPRRYMTQRARHLLRFAFREPPEIVWQAV